MKLFSKCSNNDVIFYSFIFLFTLESIDYKVHTTVNAKIKDFLETDNVGPIIANQYATNVCMSNSSLITKVWFLKV